MKFLCLGYFDPERMDARPKSEIDAIMGECQPHMEQLYGSGQVTIDAGVTVEAKSIRRQNDQLMITDGRFIEARAMIGSVFLIEAEEMEEAIRVASRHPAAQLDAGGQFGWGIEIRPIHYFKQMASVAPFTDPPGDNTR